MRCLFAVAVWTAIFCCGCGKGDDAAQRARGNAAAILVAQAAPVPNPGAAAVPMPAKRKIIYTADVALVTENLDDFRARLTAALQRFQGFVAAQQLTGRTGNQRVSTWTVRLPVEHFSKFTDELATWGELESQKIKSDDVTEEFVDVESRLRNKRIEEQRLLKILEEQTKGLEQVLTMERAIHEVREQIEQMEGRMRHLADKIDLTTITISVREVQDYIPPQPATFSTEISRTFQGSLRNLTAVGKVLLLAIVAIAPWLVPMAFVGLPVGWFFRRFQRQHRVSR